MNSHMDRNCNAIASVTGFVDFCMSILISLMGFRFHASTLVVCLVDVVFAVWLTRFFACDAYPKRN